MYEALKHPSELEWNYNWRPTNVLPKKKQNTLMSAIINLDGKSDYGQPCQTLLSLLLLDPEWTIITVCLFEKDSMSCTSPDTCVVNKMLVLTPHLWHMLCSVRAFKQYPLRGSALVLNITTGVTRLKARARKPPHYDDIQHNSMTLSVILLSCNSSRSFTSA